MLIYAPPPYAMQHLADKTRTCTSPSDDIPIPLLQLPSRRNINPLHISRLLQPLQIIRRKLHIRILHPLESLVLAHENGAQNHTADGCDDRQADDDAHGGAVVGFGPGEVGEGCPDGGGIADGVDEGEGGGAFGWRTGDGIGDPSVGLWEVRLFSWVMDLDSREGEMLTVPFMAKMKIRRKREKYLAPKFSANMKMKQPTRTMGTGYM